MLLLKIDRYILRSMVRSAIFYTILPTMILWLVQFRKIFELIAGSSSSVGVILKLSLYLIPSILPHIIPFSVVLSAIIVTLRLYNDNELVVFWASGLSPARLMRSFILFSFLSSFFILFINFFVAAQVSRQLKIEILNVKNDLIKSALKPGIIQKPQKDIMIYIDSLKGSSYLKGFYMQQNSNEQIRIFTASKALLKENNKKLSLLLLDGRILQWNYKHSYDYSKSKTYDKQSQFNVEEVPVILEFDKFTLNMSNLLSVINKNQDVKLKARDYSIIDLLLARGAQTKEEKTRFITRGHEQITLSLLPLLFVLIAVLNLLRPMPPRGFRNQCIIKTVFFIVLVRIIVSVLYNYTEINLLLITFLHIGFIILVFAMIGYVALQRRSKV